MRLDGQVVLVTGASRGIGQATAICLAKAGAQVVIHGRSEENLVGTAEQILSTGGLEPLSVIYDVRDGEAMKQALLQIKKTFGRLNGLVNNAGIMTEGLLAMTKTDDVQQMIDVNVIAVLQHMQFASRLMMKERAGSIVNLSSIIGTRGSEGSVAYSASKAAIVGATLSAAKEWASAGIRVNAVAPGFIETDLTVHYEGEKKSSYLKRLK